MKLPDDVVETVCVNCREINLLTEGEKLETRRCDDCKRIGTVLTFPEFHSMSPVQLSKMEWRITHDEAMR